VETKEAGLPALSQREDEVLRLLARGFSYGEIARLQQVSVHTTRSHAKNLYIKLNVHSKNEAVFEAAALGLLDPATWGSARPAGLQVA
jgi:DNA-binding CsgD family transcriptional regulator